MANSVDPDEMPLRAVSSESALFAKVCRDDKVYKKYCLTIVLSLVILALYFQ